MQNLKQSALKTINTTTKRIKTRGCVYENYMEKLYEKTNKQKLKPKQKKRTFQWATGKQ